MQSLCSSRAACAVPGRPQIQHGRQLSRTALPAVAQASISGRAKPVDVNPAQQHRKHVQRSFQEQIHDTASMVASSFRAFRVSATQAGLTASLAMLMAASPAGAEGPPKVDAAQAVTTFNNCALSRKKCVAQRVDENLFPVPPDSALDKNFDLNAFTGRWYISAGLNKLFDLFDCQVHYFDVPEPGRLEADINWRISKGNGDFLERSTHQTFIQQANPAILWNHDNQYLHYEDDWYILASKKNEYIFIYYKGNNDAWKGYGGAVIYTREPNLPEKYVPELKAAAERAGIDWDQIKRTDNTCKAKGKGSRVSPNFEGGLKSFGKGFTVVEKDLFENLNSEDIDFGRKIIDAEELVQSLADRIKAEVNKDEKAIVNELTELEEDASRTLSSTWPWSKK